MLTRAPRRPTGARTGLTALAVAAFAMICCAALPLLVALASGVALGALLGAGAGALALAAGVALVAVRVRRRSRRAGRELGPRT